MTEKILILGSGQMGRALVGRLGEDAIALRKNEIDLLDDKYCQKLDMLLATQPVSAVINAAAYTQVDKAESEPKQAYRINGEAVGELAAWCKNRGIPLLHFSTDYVFDGEKKSPYREDDPTNPLSVYGKSKLAGERAITAQGGNYLILRTSLIYDGWGNNFFMRIMRQLNARKSLDVVSDQISSPTYAPHLAEAALAALKQAPFSGIYHMCGGGEASRYQFAEAILALSRILNPALLCEHINATTSASYPTPARRPLNSRLDCGKARTQFSIALPAWETGLRECLGKYYAGDGLQNSRT